MAKFGILAALDCEIAQFISDFAAVPTDNPQIYRGSFAGHDIYLTLCGVGKVNAAICAQRLIDLAQVELIINSGVAGAVTDKLGICDLAISDSLTYHDFYPLDVLEKYAPGCSVFRADKKLLTLAQKAAEQLQAREADFHFETGCIVSGDRFVEDAAYKQTLADTFGAICTEMEGAAVAHTAVANGLPFAVIRAISDNADENADMSFEAMAAVAAKHAVFIVKEMIAHYEV